MGGKGLLKGEASDPSQGLTLSIVVLETLLGPLPSPAPHQAKALTKHYLSPSCIQGQVHIKTISDCLIQNCNRKKNNKS